METPIFFRDDEVNEIPHIPTGGSEIPRSPDKQCVLLGIAGIQLSEPGAN